MTPFLLDASVLIPLALGEHEFHEAASRWFARDKLGILCPMTQGSLIRYLVRLGSSGERAIEALGAFMSDERIGFWPDDSSYTSVSFGHIIGHRQVTDAYLAHLAAQHSRTLVATFDQSFAQALPDHTFLVPGPGHLELY